MNHLFTINGQSMSVKGAHLHKYPTLEVAARDLKTTLACPTEINDTIISIIKSIAQRGSFMEYRYIIQSHGHIVYILEFAKYLQISEDKLHEAFDGWTDTPNFIRLTDREYMYKCYQLFPETVSFRKYFAYYANTPEPLSVINDILSFPMEPTEYLNAMIFFNKFDFNMCFDGYSSKTQSKINKLNAARSAMWETFLISPFKSTFASLPHTPTSYDIWSCDHITCAPRPAYGVKTLTALSAAVTRLADFTCGLLTKPVISDVAKIFPTKNVVIAGGSIAKILSADYNPKNARQSDLDLFVIGKTQEERKAVVGQLLSWFDSPDTYYAVNSSVVSVYIKGIMRKFQIISCQHTNPYEVMRNFDQTHLQWCYYNNAFLGTASAFKAMQERVTMFDAITNLKPDRLVKTLYNGYHIVKSAEIIEDFIDITELIKNAQSNPSIQLTKIIRNLHSWYYPTSIAGLDFEDESQHILAQIEKDTMAQVVTKSIPEVFENIVIGGNFKSSYEIILYSTFSQASIVNTVAARRATKISLMSRKGLIRLTTPIMRVADIITSDASKDIILTVEDNGFIEFCTMLETDVYRMYKASGVNKNLITDNKIKFSIPAYRLQNYVNKGISCIHDQRGEPLDISNDLRQNDNIQILFSLNMLIYQNEHRVELNLVKIIKYVDREVTIDEIPIVMTECADEEIEYAELDI